MKWVDVMGPTGVGKSTLCTPDCNPDDFPQDRIELAEDWQRFERCARRLCERAAENGYSGAWRMTQNAILRMAHIAGMRGDGVYMNVGLAHRGLSIAWRLPDLKAIEEFYALMPVSIGVASLHADPATLKARNIERGRTIRNKQRSELAVKMEGVRPVCVAAIKAAGIALIEIDTREPVADNVQRLRSFAGLAALAPVG
jgi:hypothetical protein